MSKKTKTIEETINEKLARYNRHPHSSMTDVEAYVNALFAQHSLDRIELPLHYPAANLFDLDLGWGLRLGINWERKHNGYHVKAEVYPQGVHA